MKRSFTHKELTLLAGVVVALIIILAYWLRPVPTAQGDTSRKIVPAVTKPAAKAVLEKVTLTIQYLLQ
ncbi:MAG TPA: hypothetical protein VGK39_04290 [Cyclobacteriaceae bacterium]